MTKRLLLSRIIALLLLVVSWQAHAQDETYYGGTLDDVTVPYEETARKFRQLLDVDMLLHSLGAKKVANDERLVAFVEGFMERNGIGVVTISYVDSDELWPSILKNNALKKIEKAPDATLVAGILFFPEESMDGETRNFTASLVLEGKTNEVYDLLNISGEDMALISEDTSDELIGNQSFSKPKEAQDKVVNAMIAALQKVEQIADPEGPIGQVVTFRKKGNQKHGFDIQTYDQLQSDYPTIVVGGESYPTAWKSLKATQPDEVIAIDTSGQEVAFELDGIPVNGALTNGKYTLSPQGSSDGTEGELLAKVGETTVGKLNTVSYSLSSIDLKIVPVNGAGSDISQAALQRELNSIYAPAVASWNVQVLDNQQLGNAWDPEGNGLDDGETGSFTNYTDEMNDLIKEFKRQNDRDKDAYYIFLVKEAENPSKLGYMPRKKQWGFVFTNGQSTEALTKTIAHELGHGVYRLEHTFSEKGLPKGQTDNLMDYSSGKELYKYQWDYVHDPASVVTLFDDEEEAAMVASYEELLFDELTFAEGSGEAMITIVSPAGKPIQIPENSKRYYLTTDGEVPPGSLIAFKYDSKWYKGVKYGGEFRGYREGGNLLWGESQEWETSSLTESNLLIHYGFCSESSETEQTGYFTKPTELNLTGFGSFATIEIRDGEGNAIAFPNCDCEKLYAEYKDSPLMDSYLLANSIEGNHCLLLGMRTTGEGLGYETEFMQNLNRVVGTSLTVAFLPAAIEILLPTLVETAASAFSESTLAQMAEVVAQEKAREFAIGFTMDGVLQIALLHYFEDEPLTPAILDKLEYSQMALSGIENATNNIYAGAAISCLYDGFSSEKFIEGYRLEDFSNECAWGLASYMLAQGITKLPGLNHNLVKLKKVLQDTPLKFIAGMKNLNISDELIVSTGKHLGFNETDLRKWLRDVNYLRNSWLPGWDKNRVLSLNKPDRPIPRTYLSVEYIRKHLGYFEETGSAFIVRKRDIIDPNAHPTLAPRKFVGLLSEMEAVIQKFTNSGGDARILIEELDLGDNYIQELDEVFFVKIEPGDSRFVYGMPSGNEFGAYEGLWEPGGKTKHGTLEAVLVNADQFIFSKSWDSFLEIFGRDNVIQLK